MGEKRIKKNLFILGCLFSYRMTLIFTPHGLCIAWSTVIIQYISCMGRDNGKGSFHAYFCAVSFDYTWRPNKSRILSNLCTFVLFCAYVYFLAISVVFYSLLVFAFECTSFYITMLSTFVYCLPCTIFAAIASFYSGQQNLKYILPFYLLPLA